MKTRCLALAATVLLVVPTVTSAGFIAIPLDDGSGSASVISLLSGDLDSLADALSVSDFESDFDSLSSTYAEPDASMYSFSSLSDGFFDPPLAEALTMEVSSMTGTLDSTPIRISEPGTLALVGIGLIAICLFRRRVAT